MVFAEVEDLFAHDAQDVQRVLALGLARLRVLADVGDETLPGVAPLELDDGDESGVQFGYEVGLVWLDGLRLVQHHLNQHGPDRVLVRISQYFPPGLKYS